VHKVDFSSPLAPDAPPGTSGFPTPSQVRHYLESSPYLEVLVLLGGTEDMSASSIEARHSYTLDDIFWNRAFATCVSIDSKGYHCIDFHAIHDTYPLSDSGISHAHSVPLSFPAMVENEENEDSPR